MKQLSQQGEVLEAFGGQVHLTMTVDSSEEWSTDAMLGELAKNQADDGDRRAAADSYACRQHMCRQ